MKERIIASFQSIDVLKIIQNEGVYKPQYNEEYAPISKSLKANPIFFFELTDEIGYLVTVHSVTPTCPAVLIVLKSSDYRYINQPVWFAQKGLKNGKTVHASKIKPIGSTYEIIKESIRKEEVLGAIIIRDVLKESEDSFRKAFLSNTNANLIKDQNLPAIMIGTKVFWEELQKYLPNSICTSDEILKFCSSSAYRDFCSHIRELYKSMSERGADRKKSEQRFVQNALVRCSRLYWQSYNMYNKYNV